MDRMSDKEIEAIQAGVETKILRDSAGHEYTTKQVHPLREWEEAVPDIIGVSTLTGFIDFCEQIKSANVDPDLAPTMIHVYSHSQVKLVSDYFGDRYQRAVHCIAEIGGLFDTGFRFGEYYDHETFIVSLQSLFMPNPSRAEVLKVIGTIKENQVREYGDDGTTQSVAARSGVALVDEIPVPNPVMLNPFRTFREIEQPESPFILRVRMGAQMPQCALFEADGGSWKLEAIKRIKEYLIDKNLGNLGLTIIA